MDSAEQDVEFAPWRPQTWQLLGKILGCLGKVGKTESATKRAEEVQRVRNELAEEIDAT